MFQNLDYLLDVAVNGALFFRGQIAERHHDEVGHETYHVDPEDEDHHLSGLLFLQVGRDGVLKRDE